jgi:hypothetical protein
MPFPICVLYLLPLTFLLPFLFGANASKSLHVTFTTRSGKCPPVHLNNMQLPREDHVKYLGLHLDRRLTWRHHIFAKRKQLGLTLTKLYWLFGRKSLLSFSNKILLYKIILKPIWTYGIQLWGTASTSNVEILGHFQSKALRLIVVCAEHYYPTQSPHANGQGRNPPLQLSLLPPPQCTP